MICQYGELVAADARHHVARSQAPGQPLGGADQELVATLAPEAVVDETEPVEVDDENGETVVGVLMHTPERAVQAIHERGPVGQLGQGVVGANEVFEGRDVRVDDATRSLLPAQRPNPQLRQRPAALLAPELREQAARLALARIRPEGPCHRVPIVLVDARRREVFGVGGRRSEELARGAVHV